jgi:uncharacterized protein YoxC
VIADDAVRVLLAPLRALVSIEREMRGLRGDMRDVLDGINGLREDVQQLHGGVGRIGDATVNLEAKVDELGVHIDALGTLAGRLGRFGARRREPIPG